MINKPSDLFGKLDWSDLQTQYMDALKSFNDSLSGKTKQATAQEQWLKALDFWWQSSKGAIPEEQQGFYSHLLNQGKSLYFLADQFSQITNAVSSMEQSSKDWVRTVEEQIEKMKASFQTNKEMGMEGFQDIFGTFSLPNDAWSNFSGSIPGFAQGLGVNFKGMELDDSQLDQILEKFISIPGVGYNREIQEKIQKNILLYRKYQKVNDEYNQAMSGVGVDALEKLKLKLLSLSNADEKIESLREIYNLWVDCNEEAYAEYVYSEEYSQLNGRLVNSLMEYKKHHSELMQELFSGFNIPSKKELDDLLVAQENLRHKLKQAEKEKADSQSRLDRLEQELKVLRTEIKSDRAGSTKAETVTKVKNRTGKPATKPATKRTRGKTETKSSARTKSSSKKKSSRKKAARKTVSNVDHDVIEIKF